MRELRLLLFLLFCVFLPAEPVAGQAVPVRNNPMPLVTFLDSVSKHYQVSFIYEDATVHRTMIAVPKTAWGDLEKLLSLTLTPANLSWEKITAFQFVIRAGTGKAAAGNTQQLFIRDSLTGEALGGVTVLVNGVNPFISGKDGSVSLPATGIRYLLLQATGYQAKTTSVPLPGTLLLSQLIMHLEDVTVLGSHTNLPRTKLETTAPVDILKQADLAVSGQQSLGQMLHFTAPSFNALRYGINNVASYTEQATLRGLGPDQFLVLVNGKRRHNMAAINMNNTVGKGTAGTDLAAIPFEMIEKVEILHDGAAAQYGSDAIAGIVNIVLKKNMGGEYDFSTGKTAAGDGAFLKTNLSYGMPLSGGKGFLQAALGYEIRQATNRAQAYQGLVYRSVTDTAQLAGPQYGSATAKLQENKRLDDSLVAARGFNRMQAKYGDAALRNLSFWLNMEMPLQAGYRFYAFGGTSVNNTTAYGFYRFPNFSPAYSDLFKDGYLPEFPARLTNQSLTAGVKKQDKAGWQQDFSITYGSNRMSVDAVNTVNASIGSHSPTHFYTGATSLEQGIVNIDLSKKLNRALSFSAGLESRLEHYRIRSGEPASYLNGNTVGAIPRLPGANGRTGFTPAEALSKYRSNTGVYTELSADVTHTLLLSAAVRYEHYSDFGGNLSGKLAARKKISQNISLRSSISLNFRAPSLQQVYYEQQQFQFFQKGGQSGVYLVQHYRGDNPALQELKIPRLSPETSLNMAVGITGRIGRSFYFTADCYYIPIKNRIIVSGRLDSTVPALRPLLARAGVSDIQFFVNALNTVTTGMEITAHYNFFFQPKNTLALHTAASVNRTAIDAAPKPITVSGTELITSNELLPRQDRGIIEQAQPIVKLLLSADYSYNVFRFHLQGTYFGKVAAWENDAVYDQRFRGKTVTDAALSWHINPKTTVTAGCNNIFNVYPDKIKEVDVLNSNLSFGGQIPYSRTANQFGFNGLLYYLSASLKF